MCNCRCSIQDIQASSSQQRCVPDVFTKHVVMPEIQQQHSQRASGAKQTTGNIISSVSMVLPNSHEPLQGVARSISEMHQLTYFMFGKFLEQGQATICHARHHQFEAHMPPHVPAACCIQHRNWQPHCCLAECPTNPWWDQSPDGSPS